MTLLSLTKTLLAAGALTVLAAAPAAHAVEKSSTKARFSNASAKFDARKSNVRNRVTRNNRSLTSTRGLTNNRSLTSTRSLTNNRGLTSNRRISNNRTIGSTRNLRNNRSIVSVNNFGLSSGFNTFGSSRFSSFGSPYRSAIGISFNFGSPSYSGYRWGSSPYGFYNSGFGSFSSYKRSTVCHRVNRIGYHHGFEKLISVIECKNPYSGTYFIKGSERLLDVYY